MAGDTLRVPGLRAPVEIIRDRSGISHIYAKNEHDLFFAQGYSAARDRLFQLELWRRQATGTVSELLGKRELAARHRHAAVQVPRRPGGRARDVSSARRGDRRRVRRRRERLRRRNGARPFPAAARVQAARHEARQVDARRRHLAPSGLARQRRRGAESRRAVAAIGPALVKELVIVPPGRSRPEARSGDRRHSC